MKDHFQSVPIFLHTCQTYTVKLTGNITQNLNTSPSEPARRMNLPSLVIEKTQADNTNMSTTQLNILYDGPIEVRNTLTSTMHMLHRSFFNPQSKTAYSKLNTD